MSDDRFGTGEGREPGRLSPRDAVAGRSGATWPAALDGTGDAITGVPTPPPVRGDTTGEAERVFDSVQDWVSGWLAPTISAELTTEAPYWCRQWWRHNEAVARLDACWRAWEFARELTCAAKNPAPAAMSQWWRDHGSPHLEALLMSSHSPFTLCSRGVHTDRNLSLPVDPPPAEWAAAPISRLS